MLQEGANYPMHRLNDISRALSSWAAIQESWDRGRHYGIHRRIHDPSGHDLLLLCSRAQLSRTRELLDRSDDFKRLDLWILTRKFIIVISLGTWSLCYLSSSLTPLRHHRLGRVRPPLLDLCLPCST